MTYHHNYAGNLDEISGMISNYKTTSGLKTLVMYQLVGVDLLMLRCVEKNFSGFQRVSALLVTGAPGYVVLYVPFVFVHETNRFCTLQKKGPSR